jgi:histidine triad (HIT) family protein
VVVYNLRRYMFSVRLKSFYFILVILGLGIGVYFFSFPKSSDIFFGKECPFCNPSILEKQKFYEDDLVLALYTHKPVMDGHCLILPKRHIERFEMLSNAEAAQICQVIKKINPAAAKVFGTSSYLLLQKNGREVGQTVPHIHVHYIPRKAGDHSTLKFLFKMLTANIKPPISSMKMEETVEKMKEAMD